MDRRLYIPRDTIRVTSDGQILILQVRRLHSALFYHALDCSCSSIEFSLWSVLLGCPSLSLVPMIIAQLAKTNLQLVVLAFETFILNLELLNREVRDS